MKQLDTFRLKLKRYNIHFQYNENLNQIEIGKSLNNNRKLILGIVLLSVGLVLFIVATGLLLDIGPSSKLTKKLFLLIPIGVMYLGGAEIFKYIKLKKNNKRKIISPTSIIIQEGEETHIKKEQISDLDYFIENVEDTGEPVGSLYLLTKPSNEKIILLTLYDKDYKYLKNDLIFLKDSIKEYMGL
ncbi:hypothetical protein [Flagellimonas aequoris]|uniref:Uncharacterized protein n=1 Tax=Flagellimonas aequoris TaxID=2306997 RepID=A0A418N397_9FLAO|nr:hypothetical protein [Allomuricauda aequoris]RIV68259.1 hypothetical protein D2U88_13585 [Allomuricauda aequoris]TXJ99948.1 hypothetical protein FQ019_13435 [Allomuricauda aequoris]